MTLDLLILVGYLTVIVLAVIGGVATMRWVVGTYRIGKQVLDDRDD